jgi:hypothetical protein
MVTIKALVIDVNGTLFDPISATVGVFEDLGIDSNSIQVRHLLKQVYSHSNLNFHLHLEIPPTTHFWHFFIIMFC